MSNLLSIRQKLNLTQEELSEKSGVSVRTIQRIESGISPKGYTLKVLAKSLDVSETSLIGEPKAECPNNKWTKIINLSSLLFIVLPPLNFLVPLMIMIIKKEFNPITRKILSIQLLWTLIAMVLLLIILILNDWFAVQSKITMSIAIIWMLVNSILIFRNAVAINSKQNPDIIPNITVL